MKRFMVLSLLVMVVGLGCGDDGLGSGSSGDGFDCYDAAERYTDLCCESLMDCDDWLSNHKEVCDEMGVENRAQNAACVHDSTTCDEMLDCFSLYTSLP